MWNIFKKQEVCFVTLKEANRAFERKFTNEYDTYFDVAGSAQIRVGNSCNSSTGSVTGGISISTSCTPGGVISRQEAERLANHLLKTIKLDKMKEKEIEQKENILLPLLKGKSVLEAEKILYEALRVVKLQSTVN